MLHHSCLCDSAKNISSKPLRSSCSQKCICPISLQGFFNFSYVKNYLKTHVLHDLMLNHFLNPLCGKNNTQFD